MLFANTAAPVCVDAEMGVYMQAKPITELDRLAFVYQQISLNQVVPKGKLKYTPAQKFETNEAFCGLSKDDSFKFENWQFTRKAQGAKK